VEVVSPNALSARAGVASSITSGQIRWQVALGFLIQRQYSPLSIEGGRTGLISGKTSVRVFGCSWSGNLIMVRGKVYMEGGSWQEKKRNKQIRKLDA